MCLKEREVIYPLAELMKQVALEIQALAFVNKLNFLILLGINFWKTFMSFHIALIRHVSHHFTVLVGAIRRLTLSTSPPYLLRTVGELPYCVFCKTYNNKLAKIVFKLVIVLQILQQGRAKEGITVYPMSGSNSSRF